MPSQPHNLSRFEALPGEIRNQIYELCISNSIASSKSSKALGMLSGLRLEGQAIDFPQNPTRKTGIHVSVLPRWSGPGKIKTSGIGPLPLLFVNKRLHNEIFSLIDSRVEDVVIGPYGIQFADEDPNVRWRLGYELLKNRPFLRKEAKSVQVILPWLRRDMLKYYWKSIGHNVETKADKSYGLQVIPGLMECLQTFSSISKLQIILVAEAPTPPNMELLLPLLNLSENIITTISIVEPQLQTPWIRNYVSPLAGWNLAWNACLSNKGGSVVESAP